MNTFQASMLAAVCSCAFAAALAGAEFYVSPEGDDANPGTKERPFATIDRAREEARKAIAAKIVDKIVIYLRGGRYELYKPLHFDHRDSGTDRLSVTYAAFPGEKPILSGGRVVTGWKKAKGELWQAELPETVPADRVLRQLFVNGRRAIRARTPNIDSPKPYVRLTGASLSKDRQTQTLTVEKGVVGKWSNAGDIEVIILKEWATTRKRLESVDAEGNTATLAPPHALIEHAQSVPRRGNACYFENAPEMLDQPGEWRLDRHSSTLYYWPLPGEDMNRAHVVAPVIDCILDVRGTQKKPVTNLHFKGLTFAHTEWQMPDVGYHGVQACYHMKQSYIAGEGNWLWEPVAAAVYFEFAESCGVTDGEVAHAGGGGIILGQWCSKNTIEGNDIHDVGANGVGVGEHVNPPYGTSVGNRIANNHVHACGALYHGAVGIWVGMTDSTQVSHNLLHDLPYTGVSVGWRWDPSPSACKGNVIEYNHIYDVMKLLADGGGIYTLGFQPGTVLRGNLIHDVHRSRFVCVGSPNNGIFLDQGSKGFLVEGNVIYATSGNPIRFNQCQRDWMEWKGNSFGRVLETKGVLGRAILFQGGSIDVQHSNVYEPECITVEAWIRMEKRPPGTDKRKWIVGKNANEWVNGHYALVMDDMAAGAYVNIGGGRENCHVAWSKPDALELRRWQHMAMTYDGSVLRVFVNGELAGSKTIDKKRVPGDGPLSIGRRPDEFGAFAGAVDEVRIYNRALSAEEVKAHSRFTTAAPPMIAQPEKDMVAYWGFQNLPEGAGAEDAKSSAGLEPQYRLRLAPDERP